MRLISQDGMIDVPYEISALSIGRIGESAAIYVRSKLLDEKPCVFATYSTEVKAIKAMEMLRNAYCGKVIFQNVTMGEDVLELMKEWKMQAIISKTDSEPRIEYINNNIFVFPKDEEVEV